MPFYKCIYFALVLLILSNTYQKNNNNNNDEENGDEENRIKKINNLVRWRNFTLEKF